MSTPELLTCPWCQKQPEQNTRGSTVWCSTEGCPLRKTAMTLEAWNRRCHPRPSYTERVRAIRTQGDNAVEAAYRMYDDYDFLKMALEKTPVFGLIDCKEYRDPVLIRKWIDGEYRASVRGVGYIEEPWDEFVRQAKKYNLKYVIPHDLMGPQLCQK